MFSEVTYEQLLQEVLDNAPEGVDTRPGSIFYDAVSGILMKVARLYVNLEYTFDLFYIDTATGEHLDKRAAEYGITRDSATPAHYAVTFEGASPEVGERFYTDGVYFVLQKTEDGEYFLQSEEDGADFNVIYSGTPAIPVNNIDGLTAATFGVLTVAGKDAETDESLRTRVQEKIAGPTENANRQQYKYWCESVEGVGRARIYPLWNGPNTVKAILLDSAGKPCESDIVAAVQNYIDPATNGYTAEVDGNTYTVGDGLGEGVAAIGAHFTAAAAKELLLTVELTAELKDGTTTEAAVSEATAAIEEYLQALVLESSSDEQIVVRRNAIGAIINSLPSILDYSSLTLNGEDENITPGDDEVPILEEVVINVVQ